MNKKNRFNFFLIVPIGLEEAAKQELLEWCSILSTEFGKEAFLYHSEVVKGGIEVQFGSPSIGYILNACLKLPSRILQRVHVFQTREWLAVERELKSVEWKLFFPDGISDWEISASESKMNNEKHLSQFLKEKFENKFYSINEKGRKAFLRVHNNIFTLSLDTSGDHLHFRGYRNVQGEAPLRENLAAFLWYLLIRNLSRFEVENALIIDPFVGSGTLLIEAQIWNQILQSRKYHSLDWISKEDQFKFEKIKERLVSWKLDLVGVDHDEKVLMKAQQNSNKIPRDGTVTFFKGDSLNLDTESYKRIMDLKGSKSLWLISNPPYGGKGRLKSEESWRSLWEGALNTYQPMWAVGLGPERECRKDDKIGLWKCVETQRFLNGGIRVIASLWKKTNGVS